MLRALQQGNTGIGVLQEIYLMEGIYMQHRSGYYLQATKLESRHRRGIAISWRREEVWKLEGAIKYSPDVVSFTTMVGGISGVLSVLMYFPTTIQWCSG